MATSLTPDQLRDVLNAWATVYPALAPAERDTANSEHAARRTLAEHGFTFSADDLGYVSVFLPDIVVNPQ